MSVFIFLNLECEPLGGGVISKSDVQVANYHILINILTFIGTLEIGLGVSGRAAVEKRGYFSNATKPYLLKDF